MTSATDNRTTELREKLTERGVEYTANDHMGAYETSWNGFTAMQLTPSAKLMMAFTPEQAIAATLGSDEPPYDVLLRCLEHDWSISALRDATHGTLTAKQVMAIAGKHQPDYCSDMHVCFDWQAIADELNAKFGGGTCEYVIEDNMNESEGMGDVWFRCTNCCTCYDYYADDWLLKMPHCPKCGAIVEGVR